MTRSDTGKSIEFSDRFSGDFDATSGGRTFRGKFSNSTAPGAGVIYSNIGRQVSDANNNPIFAAGQDEAMNSLIFACDFLA